MGSEFTSVQKLISLDPSDRFASSPFHTQKFRLRRRANQWPFFARPAPQEGRIAIVTDVGGRMRWTPWLHRTSEARGGRQRRVVLIPRRWGQASRETFARGDGGNKARFTGESAL